MKKIFTLLFSLFMGVSMYAQTDCSDLYFSEYIEGSSNNKALEIYNPTTSTIDLSTYGVALFSNGSTSASNVLVLAGKLEPDSTYRIVNSSADAAILGKADTTHTVTYFNGDDAVVLGKYNGLSFDTLDIIGIVGVDPGKNWPVGTGSTAEYTLVRKSSVKIGTTKWKISSGQWDVKNQDDFSFFGTHTSACHSTQGGNNTISIKELRVNDADGNSIYIGKEVVTGGIVNNSTNFGGSGGMQISFQSQGWGITTYLSGWTGYSPTVGDSIWVYGTLGQFNGLTQFTSVDSIVLKATGVSISPEVITSFDESMESKLVKLKGLSFVDASKWKSSGSFNMEVTNGTETFTVRIDSDTDIDGRDIQTSTFDLIGIGGQYDSTDPKDEGYQLLPRNWWDFEFSLYEITIAEARTNDTDVVPVYIGKNIATSGIVNNETNFGGSGGVQISFQSGGFGISSYLRNWTGYMPRVGDSIRVYGELGEFNGLTQFVSADSIVLLDSGIAVLPTVVTKLDETTESKLVKLEGLTMVDPNQWKSSGSFNVELTNGVETFSMRVDSDTDIDGRDYASLSFDLVGIGGQYDGSVPKSEGYQLFPRNWWDIDFSLYTITIAEARTNDENGISIYDGRTIAVGGVVNNETNFGGGGGMQISLQSMGYGLTTYLKNWTGYEPRVGDSIWVYGELGAFNGLTQFVSADSVLLVDSNITVDAAIVTSLNEMTESYLVKFENVELVDTNQWKSSGSFNADFTNGTETFSMRVDSDTDIPGMAIPKGKFDLIGIGGQYDSSQPHDEGYQLFPRSMADFDLHVSVANPNFTKAKVFPVPTSDILNISTNSKIKTVSVYNLVGAKVKTYNNVENIIDVSDLRDGVYIIEGVTLEGKTFTHRIVKK